MDKLRIGHGFDVHRFSRDRELIIGGVKIDYEFGLEGHSDADVLTHAIMDALLGASGLSDIGTYFPPSDKKYKNIDSLLLLGEVKGLLAKGKCNILNIDTVIMAEEPKMNAHIPAMKKSLAKVLGIEVSAIGIKATTTEQLGFTGRKEGIAASAVCLIHRDD